MKMSLKLSLILFVVLKTDSVICAAYHHNRIDEVCTGTPPGKKQRIYCHTHKQFEWKCHAYIQTKNGKIFCDNDCIGNWSEHCLKHNEYKNDCADCILAVVPDNKFCNNHQEIHKKIQDKLANAAPNEFFNLKKVKCM